MPAPGQPRARRHIARDTTCNAYSVACLTTAAYFLPATPGGAPGGSVSSPPAGSPLWVAGNVTLIYNAIGNILYKSDVGNYDYAPFGNIGGVSNPRPHAVSQVVGTTAGDINYSYDANGNMVAASGGKYRSVSYTSFNLPDSNTGVGGPSGSPRYTWQYDETHQRIRETRVSAQGTRTTWSQHPDNQGGLSFESETAPNGTVSNRHYLSAGGQTVVLVSAGALPTLAPGVNTPPAVASVVLVKLEYWHKDHLGSLAATTDHTGTVTARYAYDPFGKRRYTNGRYDDFGTLIVDWASDINSGVDRGFTGHEHLDDIGIIHMNGRLYDPLIGRFMQGDPLIQAMGNLQSYNRFSYCMNGVLNCTDPSGFSWWTKFRDKWLKPIVAIAAAIFVPQLFAYLGSTAYSAGLISLGSVTTTTITYGGMTAFGAAVSGFVSGAIAAGSLQGGIQGAFSGGMFFGAGDLISGSGAFAGGGGAITNSFAQVAIHGVVGCVTSAAGGGKCGAGALSAAFSKVATIEKWAGNGKVDGTIVSAVVGGTGSVLGGGRFANGAVTASFGYLFNYLSHEARMRLVGAGAFLGGTAGAVAAGGCTAGTGGVCALGAPGLIAGGTALGAVTGEAIANAWDQLDTLLSKAINGGPEAVQYALVAERTGLYPTVGGSLVQLNSGEVWKYGISTNPIGRYPANALSTLGLVMEIQSRGTLPQVYVAEKIQLINYAVTNGALPPGNRIFK